MKDKITLFSSMILSSFFFFFLSILHLDCFISLLIDCKFCSAWYWPPPESWPSKYSRWLMIMGSHHVLRAPVYMGALRRDHKSVTLREVRNISPCVLLFLVYILMVSIFMHFLIHIRCSVNGHSSTSFFISYLRG